jgi:hypothetical protein
MTLFPGRGTKGSINSRHCRHILSVTPCLFSSKQLVLSDLQVVEYSSESQHHSPIEAVSIWRTEGVTGGGGWEPNKILCKNRPMSQIQNPGQPL